VKSIKLESCSALVQVNMGFLTLSPNPPLIGLCFLKIASFVMMGVLRNRVLLK